MLSVQLHSDAAVAWDTSARDVAANQLRIDQTRVVIPHLHVTVQLPALQQGRRGEWTSSHASLGRLHQWPHSLYRVFLLACCRHARERFLEAHGLSAAPQLAAALPHTAAWLAAAVRQLPALEAALQAVPTPPPVPAAATSGSPSSSPGALPAAPMRAGRAAAASAAPETSSAALPPQPAARLVTPVLPRSWRGVVRLGLVSLVADEAPLGHPGVVRTRQVDHDNVVLMPSVSLNLRAVLPVVHVAGEAPLWQQGGATHSADEDFRSWHFF